MISIDHAELLNIKIFRIFRDYGHIPGIDIAFINNGYVYHTDADTSEQIPDGSIQRSGDNVLSVVLKLATASESELGMDGDNESPPVFFDIFGLIVISYPRWINVFINLSVVSLALFAMYTDVSDFSKKTDVYKVAREFQIVNDKRIFY